MFNEQLLHFIWQNQLIGPEHLTTTEGDIIQVKKPGIHNHNAGPDFLEAQLKIAETRWAGNVEIHINSSDWNKHGHQNDPNYDNVILHVVFHHDEELGLPTLELKGKIQRYLIDRYQTLMQSLAWIPCESILAQVNPFALEQMKDRLIVERLERKSESIKKHLDDTLNKWQEVYYRNLMHYMGLRVNAHPFRQLAEKLPFKLIQKHRHNLMQVEALLFGVAGMLQFAKDSYQQALQKEYAFLKQKYQLTEIPVGLWKFATMRPANFPTIRLAQLAALFHEGKLDFELILSGSDLKSLRQSFTAIPSPYWLRHYQFGKESKEKQKKIGKSTTNTIIINHIAPMVYAYGWYQNDSQIKEKAIEILENTEAEHNAITRKWEALGQKNPTAFHSQSLIELKTNYCDLKKCLNCSIGTNLLRTTK